MKKFVKRLFAAFLTGILMITAMGCGTVDPKNLEIVINIDENGVASWEPVEGAVSYDVTYVYWDDCPVFDHQENITGTSVQLLPGFGVQISAVFADGDRGFLSCSDYFGEILGRSSNPINNYDIDPDSITTWKVIESIDYSSVEEGSYGYIYFNATSPEGNTIRFIGRDAEVRDGQIILHEHGVLNSLDSVGRIYSADVYCSDPGSGNNFIQFWGGYDINLDPNPGTTDNMIFTVGWGYDTASRVCDPDDTYPLWYFADYQPNFIGMGYHNPFASDTEGYFKGFASDVTLSEFTISYVPEAECTKIREVIFDREFYGYYLEGERYDDTREIYEPYKGIYTFYLLAVPDLKGEKFPRTPEELEETMSSEYAAFPSETGNYTVGDLKDASGRVVDKETALLERGSTITINLGTQSFDVDLGVYPMYSDAYTMHDLVPYAYPEALGEMNVLMIPIAWEDESGNATPERFEELKPYLGRVYDANGNVTDYSDGLDGELSLSEYYDIASYGKLQISTFMTDWYIAPYYFADKKNQDLDEQFQEELTEWFYENYGDMDMSQFDKDANGYIDSAIFINIGDTSRDDGFNIISFAGAVNYRSTYGKEYAGTPDRPTFNCFVNMNADRLGGGTLLHEFAHGLGLIDYYDVCYTGIDAVGQYDLQSSNVGDWNVYSKYSVGWIKPEIVDGLESGEYVDITIGSFGSTGDSIIVPVDGNDPATPFSEYIAVNLFSESGVDSYYARDYDLGGAEGVRIYHIDGRMEYRDFIPWDYPDMESVPIGTVHYANDYKDSGYYNVELIQAGADNTFTDLKNLRPRLLPEDLFMAGDEFTLEEYSDFFYEGQTDCGSDFGYSIRVLSITGSDEDAQAVIRITRL